MAYGAGRNRGLTGLAGGPPIGIRRKKHRTGKVTDMGSGPVPVR